MMVPARRGSRCPPAGCRRSPELVAREVEGLRAAARSPSVARHGARSPHGAAPLRRRSPMGSPAVAEVIARRCSLLAEKPPLARWLASRQRDFIARPCFFFIARTETPLAACNVAVRRMKCSSRGSSTSRMGLMRWMPAWRLRAS
ncbi:hypothetical protein Dimus_021911, partial [Dionaea muscipula]